LAHLVLARDPELRPTGTLIYWGINYRAAFSSLSDALDRAPEGGRLPLLSADPSSPPGEEEAIRLDAQVALALDRASRAQPTFSSPSNLPSDTPPAALYSRNLIQLRF